MAVRTHQIKRVLLQAGSARGPAPRKLAKPQTTFLTARLEALRGLSIDVYLPLEIAQAFVIVCAVPQPEPGQTIPSPHASG